MPYLHLSTNVELTLEDKVSIKNRLAEILPILPGKNIDNAIVQIDSGYMHFSKPENRCAFVDLRLAGKAPAEAKQEFVRQLCDYMKEKHGVEPNYFYMNIAELDSWVANGQVF